ncbi:MAG TPA: hypothetical protein VFM18_17535 [Methanosarcina sp.]|nr:hypothetical protein [Methanosarcina sp.]
MKGPYNNPYGTWSVSTEGDCEGRSVRQLGIFTGFVDEIAFHLADKTYYSLNFRAVDAQPKNLDKKNTRVSVQFDINSGTWDMTPERRAEAVAKMMKDSGRKVTVEPGQYYASFILIDGDSPEEIERRRVLAEIETAKAKLSVRELKLLGLEK